METQPVAGADLDRLFQWQERAIDAWEQAGRRGIVEGMTGTGKTILAIKAVKRLQGQGQRVSPLIVVPTVALLDQWCTRLRKDFPDCPIGRIGDGSHGSFAAGDGGPLPVVWYRRRRRPHIRASVGRAVPSRTPDARSILGAGDGSDWSIRSAG